MQAREWIWLENLLSMSRIVLSVPAWYFLSRPGYDMLLAAAVTIVVAGITDGLDGMVARRRAEKGRLGLILDPVADKVFAAILVVALVVTRDFPVWAAFVIVGRDLVILVAAMFLLGRTGAPMPSNLSGKYAFSAVIVLLGSYVIRFPFGEQFLMFIAMALIVVSLVNYGRALMLVRKGQAAPEFADTAGWRITRKLAIGILGAIYIFAFCLNYPEWREQWTRGLSEHPSASVDREAIHDVVAVDQIEAIE